MHLTRARVRTALRKGTVLGWVVLPLLCSAPALAQGQDQRLIEAVKAADVNAVRALLEQRADASVTEADGSSALHWAVQNDDVETAELLIRAGTYVNATNRYGVGPLQAACTNGSPRMVGVLVNAGANVNAALPAGETVLMTCARTGNVAALKILIERGANVNATESWRGQTALMWAAAGEHSEAVKLLLEHGADLHARSKEIGKSEAITAGTRTTPTNVIGGFTPFLFAVREGASAAAKVLLDAGASLTETAPEGTSPLVIAILNGHYELAAFLLDQGADPNVEDVRHGSALHALEWARRPVFRSVGMGSSAIYPRIPTGRIDSLTLAKRLLDEGADPNVRINIEDPKYTRGTAAFSGTFYYVVNPPDVALAVSTLNWDGATPFWVAAKNADVPFMRLLAAHGADPLLPNRVNVTPLMAAAGAGFMQGEHPGTELEALEAVRLAIDLGNDVNAIADFGAWERADLRFSGLTALHGAAQRGANSIVQLLVDHGVRLDLKTREGWTAFNVADGIQIGGTLKNSPATAALLRQLMDERGIEVELYRYEDNFVTTGTAEPQ